MRQTNKLILFGLIIISTAINSKIFANDFDKSVIDSILLKTSDLPDGYKLTDKDLAITPQASSLYNDLSMYTMMFKLTVIDKNSQSIKSSKDKGTIFIYVFKEPADKFSGFVEGYIWGTDKPNDEHPDEIITKDNLMIVLSFKKDSKIKELYKAKIKEIIK